MDWDFSPWIGPFGPQRQYRYTIHNLPGPGQGRCEGGDSTDKGEDLRTQNQL